MVKPFRFSSTQDTQGTGKPESLAHGSGCCDLGCSCALVAPASSLRVPSPAVSHESYTLANYLIGEYIWVCLKIVYYPKPNGFADHYPY